MPRPRKHEDPAARVRAHEARVTKRGGRMVRVLLDTEDVVILDGLIERHGSAAEAIRQAIREAAHTISVTAMLGA